MKEKTIQTILFATILLIGNGIFLWMANMIDGQLTLFAISMFVLGFITAKSLMRDYLNFPKGR